MIKDKDWSTLKILKINELEDKISSVLSKYRKTISGRGPIDTTAKIVGHTIYLKMKLTYSELEKTMYKFIIENHGLQKFHPEYVEKGKIIINELLNDYGFEIKTDSIILNPDLDKDYIYVIFVLDKNLEKLIR